MTEDENAVPGARTSKDDMRHQKHYTDAPTEPIVIIRGALTPEQYEGFLLGNVYKYLGRYRHKGGAKDLAKAQVYLEWLSEHVEAGLDDDAEYVRLQTPEPQVPGKVYRWDCVTISDKCLECEHYHKPSEGTEPHKCPFGLKQRIRRLG